MSFCPYCFSLRTGCNTVHCHIGAPLSLVAEGVPRYCSIPPSLPSAFCSPPVCSPASQHSTVHISPLVVAATNTSVFSLSSLLQFLFSINQPFIINHGRRSTNLTPVFYSLSSGGEDFCLRKQISVPPQWFGFPFGITIYLTREIPFMSILQNAAAAEEGEWFPESVMF